MSNLPNPYDGYRIEIVDVPDRISIVLVLYAGGVRQSEKVIMAFKNDAQGQGAAASLRHVLRGVCRYLNSGGQMDSLLLLLNDESFGAHETSLPEDWILFDQSSDETTFVSTFANSKTGKIIFLEEDCYSEEMDAIDVLNEMRRADLHENKDVQPDHSDEVEVGNPE